jgi:Glycosyl hydrolases family 2, sugar binding domain
MQSHIPAPIFDIGLKIVALRQSKHIAAHIVPDHRIEPLKIGRVKNGGVVGRKKAPVLVRRNRVYRNSELWVNGVEAGKHPYGYTAFCFDITDLLKKSDNVLAVRVGNTVKNSRWYSGSGIDRHVSLIMTG